MKHFIIPIFIPHYGCSHQCVFCNQQKITGAATPVTAGEVTGIIEKYLARLTEKRHVEVAYYGGSFTALPLDIQRNLLLPAFKLLQAGTIHAIRLSTRPDCISVEIVNHLLALGVSVIEIGAQSLDDQVLQAVCRGHTYNDIVNAVAILQSFDIQYGLQFMVGLPKEDKTVLAITTQKAIELKPHFVRIYPTVVIADTPLAQLYQQRKYQPLSLQTAVVRSAFMKFSFERAGIPVIRTGLQATQALADPQVVLGGPFHPAFGELVDAYLFNQMLAGFLEQFPVIYGSVVVHHHSKDTSKLRGLANGNVRQWRERYPRMVLRLTADSDSSGQLAIEYQNTTYLIDPNMLTQC
ncbi:MAG: radical SAM protein [Veillonellales bacterium]